MNEDNYVKCRECDAVFMIVWNLSWETDGGPDFCPFCGTEMDYE